MFHFASIVGQCNVLGQVAELSLTWVFGSVISHHKIEHFCAASVSLACGCSLMM